jgi:hypothetical protein
LLKTIDILRQERDEARAEVERLRAELEQVISTAAIAVRGIMQRTTPPRANDVERARQLAVEHGGTWALGDAIAAMVHAAREQGDARGRVEGARQMKERATKVASEALGGYLCPYGRDKKGDPTWDHTDKDNCPVCGVNGDDGLFVCHDTYSGRIAAAIRALPEDEK